MKNYNKTLTFFYADFFFSFWYYLDRRFKFNSTFLKRRLSVTSVVKMASTGVRHFGCVFCRFWRVLRHFGGIVSHVWRVFRRFGRVFGEIEDDRVVVVRRAGGDIDIVRAVASGRCVALWEQKNGRKKTVWRSYSNI